MYNFLNSLDFSLEKNVKSYNNSFANKFIDELKNHLIISDTLSKLKQLPADTLFTLDRYEENFAVCENRSTGKMLDIPKSLVASNAREGDVLLLKENMLHVSPKDTFKQRKDIEKLVNNINNFK